MINRQAHAAVIVAIVAFALLSTPPSALDAQPATTSAPKQPAGPAIQGTYTVEGDSARVRVRRMFGDFYHLTSSDGWEGVGIFDGATYRGVFRHHGATDAPDGTIGEHAIDWTILDSPSARATYSSPRVVEVTKRWRRMRPVAAPTPSVAAPGHRPAYGEYVQVEELPEAVSRVAPVYPDDWKESLEATVVLSALVLEDGTVGDVRVVQSVPMLDQSAIASVRQWRFRPALTKNKPVAAWVAVPVKFRRP
jgi:TonB family protein